MQDVLLLESSKVGAWVELHIRIRETSDTSHGAIVLVSR
jgi:hypothetical protein